MNLKLQKELSDIRSEILKKETSFWKANDLYSEAKKKADSSGELTKEVSEILADIFFFFYIRNEDYCEALAKGEFKFVSESLNSLEANLEEISVNIDTVNEKFPNLFKGNHSCENVKKCIEEVKKLVSLGREFVAIEEKLNSIDKENFSWLEVKKIWNEVKEKVSVSRPDKWLTETAQIQKWGFLGEIAENCWEVAEEVAKRDEQNIPPNIFPSTHEELNFLQEVADEFPKILDFSLKILDEEDKKDDYEVKIQKIKAKNEGLKKFIQQQRRKLGSSSTSQPKKPNPQDQQKIQSQQEEINHLKKKLAELQNQIEKLKKNQNTNSDQPASQETQQKIETLQNKKQEIQTELKQKQSQQKELKDKVNSQSQDNKFNWLYIIIPGGILLVIMGIIIAYLLGKKNKKQ